MARRDQSWSTIRERSTWVRRAGATRNLVVLAADKNMEQTVRSLLSRTDSLEIFALDFDIFVHPAKDPGCREDAHTFLRAFSSHYEHAIVMLDRDGCGREVLSRTELELEIEQRLTSNGWNDRAAAIVLDPELEIWVWSDSPAVDAAVGWPVNEVRLRDALIESGFILQGSIKPADPKGALEFALEKSKIPRSSSIYGQIARSVSVKRCEDPSFIKFKTILKSWFPSRPGTQCNEG